MKKKILRTTLKNGNYFKCKVDDHADFEKGRNYSKFLIDMEFVNYPEDWTEVLDCPNFNEILKCFENGFNKIEILKALRQWKNQR